LAMAVLVHPFERGDAAGTAAFDPAAQESPIVEPSAHSAPLTPAARARIGEAARALANRQGPVELEWVATGDAVRYLQLQPDRAAARRPGTHARERAAWSPAAGVAGGWTWDAAHNPLPLSPAQAGLVALVDERCRTTLRQR